jgi:hypothetical protein
MRLLLRILTLGVGVPIRGHHCATVIDIGQWFLGGKCNIMLHIMISLRVQWGVWGVRLLTTILIVCANIAHPLRYAEKILISVAKTQISYSPTNTTLEFNFSSEFFRILSRSLNMTILSLLLS